MHRLVQVSGKIALIYRSVDLAGDTCWEWDGCAKRWLRSLVSEAAVFTRFLLSTQSHVESSLQAPGFIVFVSKGDVLLLFGMLLPENITYQYLA